MLNRIIAVACLSAAALFCTAAGELGCPPPSEIEPCRCYEVMNTVELTCQDMTDTEVVADVFRNAQRHRFTKFTLRDSTLQYIPSVIFEDVGVEVIEFEKVSFVNAFNDIPQDPGVKEIYVKRVRIIGGWDWELLSAFKHLEGVYIEDVPLKKLSSDFTSHITKDLKLFKCEWCAIKKFNGEEFKDLKELEYLTINFDDISNISRSLFPTPSKLKLLNLAYNKLTTLPDDIFTDMPYLRSLYLGSNQLAVLPEESFRPIVGILYELHVDFNPIKCDCRIQWITAQQQIGISGKCQSPKELSGKHIAYLEHEDFRC